jgi:predicted peroxiredoxin
MSNAPSPRKLLIIVTASGKDDRSTIALTLAHTALSAGLEVGVFLASDAVDLGRAGSWPLTEVKPFRPLAELVDGVLALGGKVWSCGSCVSHRGLDPKQMRDIVVSGIGQVVEWIQAGAQTVCL